MDWCLVLNKLGRDESEIVSESDGNTAMLTLKMGAFLLGFSCPTQTAPLSPNIAWRSEERSCAVHSTFCSCEVQNVDSSQNILTAVKLACSFAS